jgi:succinate dehydrogenase / fumarate reductase flavoprotein subunit
VKLVTEHEMNDLVVVDGHAKGIIARDLKTGKLVRLAADAVILATGGYGNVFNLSTYARGSNTTAIWRAYKRGACFANPCYTQIHPTCIPVSGDYQSKLTLMSESLRNDGRIWVPKNKADVKKAPADIPEADRDYFLERIYPSFGNLAPRDVSSRAAKRMCDEGRGVGETGLGVYLDFADAIQRYGKQAAARANLHDVSPAKILELGEAAVAERYGNLFDIYKEITDESAYKQPMRIYPAVHYTMGGLWVDYNLMSNLPGLFVLGEANFSDHGANRLGASALMQGLADGFFVVPYTIGDYLAGQKPGGRPSIDHAAFAAAEKNVADLVAKLLSIKGKEPVSHYHKRLGKIMWDYCGMSRTKEGLTRAIAEIQALKKEFWSNVNIPGSAESLNQALEKAGRVADFIELGELMCRDALTREESCGGHFREEHQHPDGECKRDDEKFAHVAAWEFQGEGSEPLRNVEPLNYETVKMSVRSYK